MKKNSKKHHKLRNILLSVLGVLIIATLIFMHFGGFSTGKSIDTGELTSYAGTVDDIAIPDDVTIVALGEATHGNSEFQKLKLDVFKHMVENYGIRAFALEGDYGGCEQVNRYIHGGDGTAKEAAAAMGFVIYRTDEMAELISYMRQYNESAAEGDDLRFYGFDMQRCSYSFQFLVEDCKKLGVNTDKLGKLMADGEWSDDYSHSEREEIINGIKSELEAKEDSAQAVHFADMLLQNFKLGEGMNSGKDNGDYVLMRDKFMAENVTWIASQEEKLGCRRIFISGHNGHVAKWGSYDAMGKLLHDELGEKYYVIGTDFYKTCCNLPLGSSGRRTNQVFYSHDPLAKTAKLAGIDECWLDFAAIPKDSPLAEMVSEYNYMGTLGEGYSLIMRLIPQSYRLFQPPSEMYNGMILIAEATPTKIIDEK